MSNSLKEKLVIVGGSLSVAALICGIGLLLKAPVTGAAPANTQEAATPAGHGAASAHGASKSKTEGSKAAPAHGAKTESKAPSHGSEKSHGSEAPVANHGTEAPSENTEAPVQPRYVKSPDTTVDFEVYRGKGDSAAACGRYDDAIRHYTMALKTVPPEKKADLELRLADATRLSPSLPLQLRSQKALESYSRILAEHPKSGAVAEAQFQVGACLAAQRRWQEALEAFNRYDKNYPLGSHHEEVRYRRAEALSTLGNPDQAGEILEQLVQDETSPERKSRAILLLARVKLQMVRTDNLTPSLPETHREEIKARPTETGEPANQQQVLDETPKPTTPVAAVRPGINIPAPKSVPEAQWAGISRCVESGNLREAQRLVRPYVEHAGNEAQQALVWAYWGRLLKAAAERGALDVKMDGIVISSRTE